VRITRRKLRNQVLIAGAGALLVAVNGPQVASAGQRAMTVYERSRPAYKATHGAWETVNLPDLFKVNAVHSVLLSTGKVLLIAGSGNDAKKFAAGTFKTVLWDPATDTYKNIPTPKDLFCGGHAFLPNGNVLIAGGTRKYEVLQDKVERAAGVMTIRNEAPNNEPFTVRKGSLFTSQTNGLKYRATEDVVVRPAHVSGLRVHPSSVELWVEAVGKGTEYAFKNVGRQFSLDGLDVPGLYGLASTISLDKQEYHGLDASYEFDPHAEKYVETGKLTKARWYPSLLSIRGGDVLAVSGLDKYGVIINGDNEVYDREQQKWHAAPELKRFFPTYPALFRLANGKVFYSGSNAGYGPDDEGRTPGIWDLKDNTFKTVPGLRDAGMNETSSSVLLPPAQDQKVMIAGGGSVGDRKGSTARTDVADLDAKSPRYTPGPDLPSAARYVSTVVLPDDSVLISGGSRDYRGRSASDVHEASLYDPASNTLTPAAPPQVGRNYHSEALLLPDGRIMTMGSDPLYGDSSNTTAGTFEQRVEIYSPPYLFHGARPRVAQAPELVRRGTTFEVRTSTRVATARLVRPSAVTHVTDTEQRSVALGVENTSGGARLTLDAREGLTPSGWYMLFVTDAKGTPSVGRWVQVR